MIGLAALLLVLQARRPAAGTIFIGALAAYTLCRQLLFPYRAEPRRSSLGRVASMTAAGLVLTSSSRSWPDPAGPLQVPSAVSGQVTMLASGMTAGPERSARPPGCPGAAQQSWRRAPGEDPPGESETAC